MKKIFYLLLVTLLCINDVIECKRTISSGSRKSSSSSSGYTTRRQQNSRPQSYATSRPATVRPASVNRNANADNTRLSYGNTASAPSYNTQNKPAYNTLNNAPPAYNPAYKPTSVNRNQAPPAYSQNPAPGHSSIQQSSYPRQSYHQPGNLPQGAVLHSGPPPSYGQPSYYGGGGGGYHAPPSYAQPSYYQPGHLPAGAVMYPAGGFPQKSSGPGLGTGLIAGAVGGAILGHVLTPTHSREVVHTQSNVASGQPATDSDRIIIINNGPPGSVTTSENGATVINPGSNAGPAAAAPASVPAQSMPMEAPVPLAPFQPGTTQAVQSSPNNAGLAPAVAATGVAGAADANAAPAPAPGSIACYPIMVNQTDPADATKVIQVEQIACYEVPQPAPVPADQQQQTSQTQMSSTTQNQPSTSVDSITQRTSSATFAESAQIKQSGALNVAPVSFWSTLSFALFITCSKLLMS